MCLSTLVRNPSIEIESGRIEEFEYAITHNSIGSRCGYLKVLPGHPWHGKHYYDLDASVHGELTFAEADEPCDKAGADDGWWVGFDCAHSGDAPDPTLPGYTSRFSNSGTVRSTDYVRSELNRLALQAKAATASAATSPSPIDTESVG